MGSSLVTSTDLNTLSDDDSPQELILVIPEGQNDRLDKVLATLLPEGEGLSRSRLARMIAEGALSSHGRPVVDGKVKAIPGTVFALRLDPAEAVETLAEDIPLVVVHEDADLIVVNKPAGMVVHPAPGSPRGTLVNALLHHCGDSLQGIGGERRPGIVHRIDKETSGLLVAAKSDRAHQGLSAQFAAHTVGRRYLAVAHGVPQASDPRLRGLRGVGVEAGGILRIATEIARHRSDRQKQAVTWDGAGRHAVTRARVMEAYGSEVGGVGAGGAASLLECWLETGRTHQIRVHMAYAGHALVGDPVYGGTRRLAEKIPGAAYANAFPRQALHAATLGFDHPVTGERLEFRCDPPEDFQTLVAGLRAGSAD